MNKRRYDIDWVRVVATQAVFLFHCTLFFVPMGWYVQNAEQSEVLFILVGWFYVWMMPLLFLLSGLSSWYSLEKRTGRQYLWERVKRLLVPLYTVGMFVLLLPQGYFITAASEAYTGTFWEWIPHYIGMIIPPRISLKNPMGLFLLPSPGHLWFLQHLFIISLVILPLLRYLKSESGQRLIDRLAGWGERRGGMFLFLIPLVLVRIALRGIFPGMSTWADLVFYAVLFLIGYLIAADRRFTESYKRLGWVCLALGLVAFMAELIFIGPLGYPYFGGAETYSWSYVVFQIVMSVGSFCWVLFILSLGAKYLNFNKKALGYAGEMQYPFYTLHMPIVLVVGWFVVRWDLGILPKYLITVVVSFALIMALYELIVRRFDVTRFLFGMRPKKKL